MVDAIGNKTGAIADRRIGAVGAAAKLAATPSVTSEPRTVETAAATLSSSMAAEAPVDVDRVAKIRKAIQDGRFPLVPTTVADRLLALKLEWDPSEPS